MRCLRNVAMQIGETDLLLHGAGHNHPIVDDHVQSHVVF
jgi:hypothetical protein